MASDIKFTYRNKAYITQLVNALAEGDVTTLANKFAQHSDPLVYKQTKDSLKPTDYSLLIEIQENFTSFTESDVHALLLALPSKAPMSTQTKIALFMVSFPYLDKGEREAMFGSSGPLAITPEEMAELKANRHLAGSYEDQTEKSRFRAFYSQSVVADQSPEDFVNKFKMCLDIGLPLYGEINRLAYQDKPEGLSAFDRYKQIFSAVGEDAEKSLVWNMRKPAINYEFLKAYGYRAFHDCQHDRAFQIKFIAEAFGRDDPEIFKQLTDGNIPYISNSQVREITKDMVSVLGQTEPSQTQFDMLAFMDEHLSKSNAKHLAERIDYRSGRNRFGPQEVILDIVASGHEVRLDSFIRHAGEDRVIPHLPSLMIQLEKYLPRMAFGKDISESQKRMALRLHGMAAQHTAEMSDVLLGIDTSKAYRLGKENGADVKLAFSKMSVEQRAQWANEITAPLPEVSSRSFDPFG